MNCHYLVPKQAGKLACHSYSGLKCSTKACFRHISGTAYVQGNRYNETFSILAGTPREELWLNTTGVRHTVTKHKKKIKVILFSKWNSDSLHLLNLENIHRTLEVDLHTWSFFWYSYFLSLLTFHPSYEEDHLFIHTASNKPAQRTEFHTHSREQEKLVRPPLPWFKLVQETPPLPACSHCITVKDSPICCGKDAASRTKGNFYNMLP